MPPLTYNDWAESRLILDRSASSFWSGNESRRAILEWLRSLEYSTDKPEPPKIPEDDGSLENVD